MSYCQIGEDSDVYVLKVFKNIEGDDAWSCCGCILSPETTVWDKGYTFETRQEMLDHLLKHRAEGHRVPEHALERLHKEIAAE